MITEIPQFLYTRVNADRSPRKKEGFQFLASTPGFPDKKTQMEIECRLHYPGSGIFNTKTAGFTLAGPNGWNLILLFYTDQPDVRDAAGRSGIFLVHGFSIPLLDTHAGLLADDIAPLLDAHICRSYEKALEMGASGEIPPLSLKFTPNQDTIAITDRDAWVWMQAGLLAPSNGQALAWESQGDESPLLLPAQIPALPLALIEKLSWDDVFDNGKLHFSPVRLTAWKKHIPTTGQPLVIGTDGTIREPAPAWWGELCQHPYVHWLLNSSWKPQSRSEVELLFAAGRFLAGDTDTLPDSLAIPDAFFSINEASVRRRFQQLGGRVLPSSVSDLISRMASPEALARLIQKSFPAPELARAIEQQIRVEPRAFSPETIRRLPAPVITASPLLELLTQEPETWDAGVLVNLDDLYAADWAFAFDKISPAVVSLGLTHAGWYSVIPDAEKKLELSWLETLLPPHIRPLGNRFIRWMLRNAPRSKDSDIGQAWLKRVRQYFTDAPEEASHGLTEFLTANRDRVLIGLPENIRRGVAGPGEVPESLQRSTIEWYTRYLGITAEQLVASGWPEQVFKPEGLLGKFKRWFS